jgi:hypothetical protein
VVFGLSSLFFACYGIFNEGDMLFGGKVYDGCTTWYGCACACVCACACACACACIDLHRVYAQGNQAQDSYTVSAGIKCNTCPLLQGDNP